MKKIFMKKVKNKEIEKFTTENNFEAIKIK